MNCAIWAMVEICIGIVSASLPTMRPIYNLIVRGHHCTAYESHCSRCEKSKAFGVLKRWRSQTKRPGSTPSTSPVDDVEACRDRVRPPPRWPGSSTSPSSTADGEATINRGRWRFAAIWSSTTLLPSINGDEETCKPDEKRGQPTVEIF